MKNRFLETLSFILLGLTSLAGILTLPQAALLPEKWQPYLVVAGGLVLWGKNGIYLVLDFMDDGKLNKSFKLPGQVGMLLIAGLCLMCVPSCSTDAMGRKTFIGLTGDDWAVVGRDAGVTAAKAGAQAAVVSYGARRAAALEVTATK